jgi:23S rRNA (adenine2030-N6)-methyltransferase
MNYQHGFHAGNFADVLKHAVLARMLVHLRAKEKPFRVIDTHAGQGAYDLGSSEAARTGEWRGGIGRLLGKEAARLDPALNEFLAPYLEAVGAWREAHGASAYPGSPALIRHFLRPDDRLVAIEAHERSFAKLARLFPPGSRAKALHLDGYTAWGAYVPPKERRGLVIVDPPFEAQDEFEQVAAGLELAAKKWPSGMALIWYPVKDRALVQRFSDRLARSGLPDLWRVELDIGTPAGEASGLSASGLILMNPPWTLPKELDAALPPLAKLLARGTKICASCRRIEPLPRGIASG